MDRPIRVIVAKIGLDGHDRGARVISTALRDAGMEVIYTGLRKSPVDVAKAALQEDVDVVGVSILSGAHMTVIPKLQSALAESGVENVMLIVGGVIPESDKQELLDSGVDKVFTPGTALGDIAGDIRSWVEQHPRFSLE